MTPKRFRKKPVVVEAMQYTLEDRDAVIAFCKPQHAAIDDDGSEYELLNLRINTLEGTMRVGPGDWVIKGVKGEFYPCKDDVFRAIYEEIEEEEEVV